MILYCYCDLVVDWPEPNMLKMLPIIHSRISQNFFYYSFFILVYSLLFHNNAHLVSVAMIT